MMAASIVRTSLSDSLKLPDDGWIEKRGSQKSVFDVWNVTFDRLNSRHIHHGRYHRQSCCLPTTHLHVSADKSRSAVVHDLAYLCKGRIVRPAFASLFQEIFNDRPRADPLA